MAPPRPSSSSAPTPPAAPTTMDDLVESVGAALHREHGAYFLGSGVSAGSGLPDWTGLLQTLARPLGLTLKPDDDLPLIAQYCVNADLGNRAPLIARIRRALSKTTKQNAYHELIARTNVRLFWTTNYDTLLEDALVATMPVAVRVNDADLAHGVRLFEAEVLKPHGCLRRSPLEEYVATREDYEDFAVRRPAMVSRLRDDLLHRTFLFVGYSYRDPNIATALVEVRRLARGHAPEHFMILRREPGPRRRRHELWAQDLRRVGIRVVFINDHGELTHALDRISRRSRGRSVFITGSHAPTAKDKIRAGALGQALAAQDDLELLDGQSDGIGRAALEAFGEACVTGRKDLSSRIHYFPNPYSFNPAFADDKNLLPMLKQARASLMRAAHTLVVFDGGMGTRAEVEVARAMGCRIVPVPGGANGFARELLRDPDIAKDLGPVYMKAVAQGTPITHAVLACLREGFQ